MLAIIVLLKKRIYKINNIQKARRPSKAKYKK
jgi:hypothetical protein